MSGRLHGPLSCKSNAPVIASDLDCRPTRGGLALALHVQSQQRADLSPAERKAHMAERVRLVIEQQKEVLSERRTKPPSRAKLKTAAPAEQHKPSGRPKGGVSAIAREAGVSEATAHRALKPEPALTMDDIMGAPAYSSTAAWREIRAATCVAR